MYKIKVDHKKCYESKLPRIQIKHKNKIRYNLISTKNLGTFVSIFFPCDNVKTNQMDIRFF